MSEKENIFNGNINTSNVLEYDMMNKKRGIALIFNHETFANAAVYGRREGTDIDSHKLVETLTGLNFEVKVHKDLRVSEIMNRLEEVSKLDFTEHDCILTVIMSHGSEGHQISAYDCEYNLSCIFHYFTDTKCPTLTGKPKLFFIQACQGDEVDPGIELRKNYQPKFRHRNMRRPSEPGLKNGFIGCYNFIIPSHFLIAFSTIPGYSSWRSPMTGSWFIQSLCDKLAKNGSKYDLLTLLTFVNQNVAMNYSSNTPDDKKKDNMKQIPCVISTLRRQLKFSER